jgi:hypothetical protein
MGHSTNTSIDSYIDTTHPVKAIPAAHVLAGTSNIHAHIVLPKLNAIVLLNATQVDKLVDKLFSVNVPAFDKGGCLRVVLRTCAASLIMHHMQLTRKFPCNAISSHLYEAAWGARISDPRFLDFSPNLVLDEWSKLVEADFQSASIAAKYSLQSVDAKLDLLVNMVKYLTDVANGLKAQNGKNMLQMADQKACLSRQQREIDEFEEQNYVASQKLEMIKTPEHARCAKRKTIGDGTVSPRNTSENLLDDLTQAETDSAFSPVTNTGVVAPASALLVAKGLSYNSRGKHIAEANNVALRARNVLQWLSSTGAVNPTDMKLSNIPTGAFKERASGMYTLELAQLVDTPQERAVLDSGRSHDC